MIDPQVLASRKIKEKYNEANQKTVLKRASHDPKSRKWTFDKVQIDPNAYKFKESVIKSEQKARIDNANKSYKRKYSDNSQEPEVDKVKLKEQRKLKQQNEQRLLRAKIFKEFEAGQSIASLCEKYGFVAKTINNYISTHRKENNITKKEIGCTTLQQVEKLLQKGLSTRQIAKQIKKARSTVLYHIKNIQHKQVA